MMERRKYLRFDVPLALKFRQSPENGRFVPGVTKNFSRDGFCFETEHESLALEDTVEFMLKRPHTRNFVSAAGTVMWKEKSDTWSLIGIRLTEIDGEIKRDILDYAYELWVERNRKAHFTSI